MRKHKVFISYHHENDQYYKEELLKMNEKYDIFIDASVDTGDIKEDLTDQQIREKIRDDYLKDSTVTILLVGEETKSRKHIDWELYSSMYDGKVNKKSGILVITLPEVKEGSIHAAHREYEKKYYPEIPNWITGTREEYEKENPYLPARIIDNLPEPYGKISVTKWDNIECIDFLEYLIDVTFRDRKYSVYDLSRPMKRNNN